MTTRVYCTSFCNRGHRLDNGHPVDHECYVLDPVRLQAERDSQTFEGSIVKEPRRVVKGLK